MIRFLTRLESRSQTAPPAKKVRPIFWVFLFLGLRGYAESQTYLSPCDLDLLENGSKLLITEHTGRRLDILDRMSGQVVKSIDLKQTPNGSAYCPADAMFYVTTGIGPGRVLKVDSVSGKVRKKLKVGHTPTAPVISPDGQTLYVCLRFDNAVAIVDLATFKVKKTIQVGREPVAMTRSPDGKFLYVANHLPSGRSDLAHVASCISVIDTEKGSLATSVDLANGAGGLRGICVSDDGKYVLVSHILARHQVPTTQLERGWVNTAGLSVISTADNRLLATVLLDDVTLGFANPWPIGMTDNGRKLVVAAAGTHELRVIDFTALMTKINERLAAISSEEPGAIDTSIDLTFMSGISHRIALAGNGPRALAVAGNDVYTADYFSDSLSRVRLNEPSDDRVEAIELGPRLDLSEERRGEMLFNDATICLQKWQSCASCHSSDGRMDGMNWDLLNDGIGNPKNAKSLLFSHETPPAMAMGVRADAETAVRAGIRYIQFVVRPDEDAQAIDTYLKHLVPVPSPKLKGSRLSRSARRGKKVFDQAGCRACHPGPHYTDLQQYDVGTATTVDEGRTFDVPGLNEVWRTAPYLHDGRAATIYDTFKFHNPDDRHGETQNLSEQELRDLAEFVESL